MAKRNSDIGCLYFLIALPLAIITLPFKLASDMGRRKRR